VTGEAKQVVETAVLIIGAGPVGMAAAIELGHRGIACLLIERNDRVGYAPRAKTTNVRTREHLRRWGIAENLKAAAPLGPYYPSNIVFATRLGGHLLARIENAMYCAPGKNPLYSEHGQWIPQYTVEEVMRTHAQTLRGVVLRFSSELDGFTQDHEGVNADVRDLASGRHFRVRARYMIAADGARSQVRTAIGARMDGKHGLSRNYNAVLHAPLLAQSHKHGPAIMYWQVNGDVPSVMGPMDRGDKWYFMPTQLAEGEKLAAEEIPGIVCRSIGFETPIEVLSSDEWVASRLIADRYRDRCVFLAGDACHLHPPFGGYGMNMGIADGVDLGWKLAAVLTGWGGPALLDSYEMERRPVHEFVMDEAVANHAVLGRDLWQPGLEDDTAEGRALREATGARICAAKLREFNTLGVVLGYRYDDSPLVTPDGTPAPPHDFVNYVQTARPGALAPHAWVHDGTSLYDHFGKDFTLLCTLGTDDLAGAREAAAAASVPIKAIAPQVPALHALYRARYALIRPDQHVAWRGDELPSSLATVHARASGRAAARAA
jgi:2-polyprenyl-6-methoxyphenol hydroxylase-like FAD-dependent oxidoreductase